jgi:hypothetical protein
MLRYLLNNVGMARSEDAAGAAAAAGGGSTTAATAPDVTALQAQLAQAQAEAAASKAATYGMFDPNKSLSERAEAAQTALTKAGFTADQAAQWVAANLAEAPQGNTREEPPAAPSSGDQALELAQQTRNDFINETYNKELADAQKDPKVASLLKRVRESRGEEAAGKIQAALAKRLQVESMTSLRSLHSRGVGLTPQTISAKVLEALSSVVNEYSTVIADASPLGRGAETSANGTQSSKRQLKEAPNLDFEELDKSGRITDAHAAIESWFKDEMLTLAEMTVASEGNAPRGKSRA